MLAEIRNAVLENPEALRKLSEKQVDVLLKRVKEAVEYDRYNRIELYYPETGPLRRELYSKHLEFFEMGAMYQQRMFMAANRIGKTEGAGAYETTLHLTGEYPEWWKGKRFEKPTKVWAAGYTGETTRDIVQYAMLGSISDIGSGMIPKHRIKDMSPKAGVPGAVDTVYVEHVPTGRLSTLAFKQYKQGRKAFEGTKRDVIWFDEEADLDVYNEALLRITSAKSFGYRDGDEQSKGIIYTTFTPLEGLSELVMSFMPQEYGFTEQV